MAFEFRLPDIGEGLTEGEVTKWLVKEGETVAGDQPMVEVMTDKATVEITSPRAGVIEKILVPDGTKVPVGTVIVTIAESGGGAAPAGKPAAKPAAAPAPAAKAPAPAAAPARPAPAAAASRPAPAPAPARGGHGPSPAVPSRPAPAAAPARAEKRDLQTSYAGGAAARAPAATIAAPPRRAPAPAAPPAEGDGEAGEARRPVLAAPATRRLAREHGIDLRTIAGSGPSGRVTRGDLEAVIGNGGVATEEAPAEEVVSDEAEAAAAPARGAPRRDAESDEHVPFTGVRGKIAEQMTRSKRHAPHFTFADECDVTDLVALREQAKKIADERGVKLTFLPFVMKALVAAMRRHPSVNSLVDDDEGGFTVRREYHFGIATDTPQGLMVPVVRDVDRRTILEIAAELERLTTAARSKKIALHDLKGSTFTITSAGSIGGILATPILNYPEVGILGVYKIADRAVVKGGQIVVRKMMNLSITLDHRVVDGATAAYFLNEVIRYLETPNLLLLEGI